MPNYIKCVLQINADEKKVNEVLNFVKSDNFVFDFNKIIPMPKELEIENTCDSDWGLLYIKQLIKRENSIGPNQEINKLIKEIEERDDFDTIKKIGKQVVENLFNYGYSTWYSWRIEKWGTKWNACNSEINENKIIFETAWIFPAPIIKALSEIFPTVEFSFKYADEDFGSNLGKGNVKNGEITFNKFGLNNETKMKMFAIKLWGCEDDYELVDGELICKEEEE